MSAPTTSQPQAIESTATKYLTFCKENGLKPFYYSSIRAYKNDLKQFKN